MSSRYRSTVTQDMIYGRAPQRQGNRMRVFVIASVMIALLPATAYSQEQQSEKPTSLRSKAQKNEDAAIEKAYQEMINRTKRQPKSAPAKSDPWHSIRPADDSAKR